MAVVLAGCATVTSDKNQEITVDTDPMGAECVLTNKDGTWTIDETPDTVPVRRSYSPLVIECTHPETTPYKITLEPRTRGRAYGNILLLGIPALVDAYTEEGYEYDDQISIDMTK